MLRPVRMRHRGHRRGTDDRPCSRPPNDPIGRRHRGPPIIKVLVSAISLPCPIGRPRSSDVCTDEWVAQSIFR
jgi:hypothetical protein